MNLKTKDGQHVELTKAQESNLDFQLGMKAAREGWGQASSVGTHTTPFSIGWWAYTVQEQSLSSVPLKKEDIANAFMPISR